MHARSFFSLDNNPLTCSTHRSPAGLSKRTFYKTVFSIEVFSQAPVGTSLSLPEIEKVLAEGSYHGRSLPAMVTELSGPEAAAALKDLGRVPWVFGLTATGGDAE